MYIFLCEINTWLNHELSVRILMTSHCCTDHMTMIGTVNAKLLVSMWTQNRRPTFAPPPGKKDDLVLVSVRVGRKTKKKQNTL